MKCDHTFKRVRVIIRRVWMMKCTKCGATCIATLGKAE